MFPFFSSGLELLDIRHGILSLYGLDTPLSLGICEGNKLSHFLSSLSYSMSLFIDELASVFKYI